jgi:hypothetical protein
MGFLDDIGSFINRTVGTKGGLLSDIGVDPFKVPAWGEDALGAAAALAGGAFALPAIGGALGLGGASDAALGGFDLSTLGSGVTDTGAGLGSAFATSSSDLATLGGAGGAAADATLPGNATLDALGGGSNGYVLPGSTPFDASFAANPLTGTDLTSPSFTSNLFGATGNLSDTTGTLGAASNAATGAGGNVGIFNSLTNAGSSIAGGLKTAAPLIGVAGLGANLYSGYEQKQALSSLNAQETANATQEAQTAATENAAAAPLLNNGQTLMTYLQTNTLPPQFQASVDQQVASAKARIIQGYASRGMPSDPTKNSALAQDLNNADQQALTLKAGLETQLQTAGTQMVQTANQLLSSGIAATQLSSQLPIEMAKLNSSLNQSMAASISSFAAALNGGGKANSVTLNLANAGGTTGTGLG